MSVQMNNFERQVVNRLQKQMSKREAESAIYAIREGLGLDMYDQIRPEHLVDENGNIKKAYPPIKKIIWAYFNDRWDVFKTEKAEVEEEAEKQEEQPQQQRSKMTKKERKAAMWAEVSRLNKAIPYMWTEFAQQIFFHNLYNPENKITDEFLLKVIEKGEQMDLAGKDARACSALQTRNSETNYKNLRTLMGEKLMEEVESYGVSWGYYASLYYSICLKKFNFKY